MPTKLYDRLFWIFLSASALFALAGCESLRSMGTIAITANPTTGKTPLEDAGSGLVAVLVNPLNWPGWVQIIAGVGTILAGGAAYKKASAPKE
jgi:hypothetical protein